MDFLYSSSVTTPTNLLGIAFLFNSIDLRFLSFKYVSNKNLTAIKDMKTTVKLVEAKNSCMFGTIVPWSFLYVTSDWKMT